MEVHPSWAPYAVARFGRKSTLYFVLFLNIIVIECCFNRRRFRHLVDAKYFDNMRFYKARSGFAAHFGIAADPKLTKFWSRKTIYDEGPDREVSNNAAL